MIGSSNGATTTTGPARRSPTKVGDIDDNRPRSAIYCTTIGDSARQSKRHRDRFAKDVVADSGQGRAGVLGHVLGSAWVQLVEGDGRRALGALWHSPRHHPRPGRRWRPASFQPTDLGRSSAASSRVVHPQQPARSAGDMATGRRLPSVADRAPADPAAIIADLFVVVQGHRRRSAAVVERRFAPLHEQ